MGQSVTQLLHKWRDGDAGALERLTPLVYNSLRELAGVYMRGERPGHTLQATAVVHEAYQQLVDIDLNWQSRTHFYAMAARIMRRILVDHARAHGRVKRGGDRHQVSLDEAMVVSAEPSPDLMALDESLIHLARQDARKAQVVELHFFGGLTYDEIAETLTISPATVDRELRMAKAWLYRELAVDGGEIK